MKEINRFSFTDNFGIERIIVTQDDDGFYRINKYRIHTPEKLIPRPRIELQTAIAYPFMTQ